MQQPNIPFEQTTAITCDECGGIYFQEALHIRKASGILTGGSQPTMIPIPEFTCVDCGHVNEAFLPVQMKDLD